MAADKTETTDEAAPTFSDVDMTKARRWFAQGKQVAQTRNYDYGIECYVTGLGFWPEAVEEGHMMLRGLAMARLNAGGKKPGMRDTMKRSMSVKDAKQAMLNAEYLMAMDPRKPDYAEGVLKNANKAGFNATVKWIGPIVLELFKSEKKPNAAKLKSLRQALEEAGDRMEKQGDSAGAVTCYELAVAAIDLVVRMNPDDGPASNDLRNISGKLTIVRGKYSDGETFRDSLADADKSKLLHDTDRVVQADAAVDNLIAAARKELEAHPGVPAKISTLVEHLLRRERKSEEDEAIRILTAAYESSDNYSFKMRADDVLLRQLGRTVRELRERARQSQADDDRQQLRLALMDQADTEIRVHEERCQKHPTDLRHRYKLALALFYAKRWDEAIPAFQEALNEPKNRVRSKYFMGRCFFEREIFEQAADVLQEANDEYEIDGDDTSKDISYWLGRALEAAGKADQAVSVYGKLLRQDYNYLKGEVRKRLDDLRQQAKG